MKRIFQVIFDFPDDGRNWTIDASDIEYAVQYEYGYDCKVIEIKEK